MGRYAQSAWVIPFFVLALAALAPLHARADAIASAQDVALGATASCSRGDLLITLKTSGATDESWVATNLGGATLIQLGGPTGLTDTDGPYNFPVGPFLVTQPPGTSIGSYVWVGRSPPDPSNAAEFFVYYNCTTPPVVLYQCKGAYGSCPQTAQAAAALLAGPAVPTLDRWALPLTALLLAAAGGLALRRRRA